MANPYHVELLKDIRVWNTWRRAHPAVRPDLTHLSLRPTEMQWGEHQGGPIDLRGADLRLAQLSYANLQGAFLHGADLAGAQIVGARLMGADMHDANLSNAYLRGSNLLDALLYGANLTAADFSHVFNLDSRQLVNAYITGSTVLPVGMEQSLKFSKQVALTDTDIVYRHAMPTSLSEAYVASRGD